jgi:hypothetical protein
VLILQVLIINLTLRRKIYSNCLPFPKSSVRVLVERELWVISYCVIALIVLIIIFALYQATYLQNLAKHYTLTSNGQITFSEDKMSLAIGNRHNDSSRIIEIDGLDEISKAKIYSSALRTSTGHAIKAQVIPHSVSDKSSGSVKFVLDTKLTEPASYDGWLLMRGQANEHIIPINVSSPPMLPQALIIVLIGSVSSIAFWEVIHYCDQKNTRTKNKQIEDKADKIYNIEANQEADQMKKFNLLFRSTSLKLQRDSTRSKEKSRYETPAGTAKVTFAAAGSSRICYNCRATRVA